MTAAGAWRSGRPGRLRESQRQGALGPLPSRSLGGAASARAAKDPYDPKEYAAYKKTVIETYTKWFAAIPEPYRPDHVYFFTEPAISNRTSNGNWPEYWQEKPYELTAQEKDHAADVFRHRQVRGRGDPANGA